MDYWERNSGVKPQFANEPWTRRRTARGSTQCTLAAAERDFFIDNLLVRIHLVMIRWTGLAP